MAAKLSFTAEAGEDLFAAYGWYEERRTGLGDEFMSRAEACTDAICRTPELYEVVRKSYRRALVRRFPYAIYFSAENDKITIYAVMHTSRKSQSWQERLS